MDKPEQPRTDIYSFAETFQRLLSEAEQGNPEALELLWQVGYNVGWSFMKIETRGTPEAKQALKRVAAKHTVWPDLAIYQDDPNTRRRLESIGLGNEVTHNLGARVTPDELTKLACLILEDIKTVGSVLRAQRTGEISTRPPLPMYSRKASRLPSLTRETLPQWWEVASQVFDRLIPRPEKVPWMRDLAKKGSSDRAVRIDVKRRLRQKMLGLARP